MGLTQVCGKPLILSFDIRPEFHRPTRSRVAVQIGGALVLLGLGAYSTAKAGWILSFVALFAWVVGVALLICGVIDWRRAREWRRDIDRSAHAIDSEAPFDEANPPSTDIYRGVLLRRWRTWLSAGEIVKDLRAAKAPLPRAILIGSPSWTARPARDVRPDLVEPELIRASPRGWGVARLGFGFLIGCIVWLFFALLAFHLFRYGLTSGEWGFAIIGAVGLCGVVGWFVSHFFGRGYASPGGAGLIAGPSRIEHHGARRVRAWTPRDTIMIVHRTRSRSPELTVSLLSDRAAGSATPATFRFFGPDDPGFRTLWKMWTHPREVERLTEV